MKKTISYILASLLLVSSCDFLDGMPSTQIVGQNAFDTEESARTAMLGCYSLLHDFTNSNFLQFVFGASVLRVNMQSEQLDSWFNHTLYSFDTRNLAAYRIIYSGISTINSFLDALAASKLDAELIRTYSAEARCLRAIHYFLAARLWGDLPIILTQPTTIEEANVPRSKYTDVYRAILDDLDFAEANMRTMEQIGETGVKEGRFCNYTATALKAKVYLQIAGYVQSPDDQWFDSSKPERYPDFSSCGIEKDNAVKAWSMALECAVKVINDGPFALEPDYANLFRFDPENHPEDYLSKERIVVIPVTPQSPTCYYSSWSLPKNPWGSSESVTSNGSKLRCRPIRFTFEQWCKKYGGAAFLKESSQEDIGSYSYYTGCPDPRLEATYFHTDYYTGVPGGNMATNHCYPYAGSSELANNNYVASNPNADMSTSNQAAVYNAFPIYRKGFSKAYNGSGTGGNADVYLMRFADVLLIAAEAAASLGENETAVSYVNRVLERARKSTNPNVRYPHNFGDDADAASPQDWNAGDFATKDDLLDAILWERVFEMEYEFQAFFDTRRRGANFYVEHFVHPLNEFNKEPANQRISNCPVFKRIPKQEDIRLVRAGLLLAFPDQELRYNTALGYSAQNDFVIQ